MIRCQFKNDLHKIGTYYDCVIDIKILSNLVHTTSGFDERRGIVGLLRKHQITMLSMWFL